MLKNSAFWPFNFFTQKKSHQKANFFSQKSHQKVKKKSKSQFFTRFPKHRIILTVKNTHFWIKTRIFIKIEKD